MGMDPSSFERWKRTNPKLVTVLKESKQAADAKVEASLYKIANGYTAKRKKAIVVSDGKDSGSHVEYVDEIVIFPPNVIACMFWLKNRQSDDWKDKREIEIPPNAKLKEEEVGETHQKQVAVNLRTLQRYRALDAVSLEN
jgi:hypothetical protein